MKLTQLKKQEEIPSGARPKTITLFPDEAFSSELPKEVLLDRYHSHTKHCSSCRQALKRIQHIRLGAAIATGFIWSLIPLVVAVSGSLTGTLGILLTVLPLLGGAL